MTPRELIDILQQLPGAAIDAYIDGADDLSVRYDCGIVYFDGLPDLSVDADQADEDGDQ